MQNFDKFQLAFVSFTIHFAMLGEEVVRSHGLGYNGNTHQFDWLLVESEFFSVFFFCCSFTPKLEKRYFLIRMFWSGGNGSQKVVASPEWVLKEMCINNDGSTSSSIYTIMPRKIICPYFPFGVVMSCSFFTLSLSKHSSL